MKKIFLFLFSFFIFPLLSFAVSNVDYDVTNYYIKANILSNGDLKVKELIVLKGSFNGYERTINYRNSALNDYGDIDFEHSAIYNSDGIKDVKVSAKYLKNASYSDIDDTDFESFEEVSSAYSGDKRKYTLFEGYDGNTYRMYYESNRNTVGFLIEYTLDNAVVMHNDVAELYWQIFTASPDNDEYDNLEVRVYLPGEDDDDTFRYWAHGPLSGEIHEINGVADYKGAVATIDTLEKDEDLDIRMTFDKSLITDSYELDHTNVDALDKILEVEEARAEEANRQRERLKKIYNFYKIGSKVITCLIAAAYLLIKFILLRKPRVDFEADYYREFIEDYNVEVIDYLFKKNLTPNALSAAIMNLIYRKKVIAEELVDPKAKKESSKKDYTFTLVDREDLNESDLKLVEFLFDRVGDGSTFTTKGLKKYASSLSTGSKFNNSYTTWSKSVINVGKKQSFFKSKSAAYAIAIPLLIISILFQFTGTGFGVNYPLLYFVALFGIILIVSTAKAKAYNEKGALHLKKWTAFRNFLKDFGDFEPKELPEVKLWERYLVYATIFGLAKKLQKDMNVKIKEFDDSIQSTYSDTFTQLYLYDSIRNSFSTAVADGKRAYAASRANAYSSSSSGGGFGGGFSSGGGFGGGGGGGHGF